MGPFLDNRADNIREVLVRERLGNIGILPSVNSTKMKRVVRLETSVCFRVTRLMNNQIKSRERATSQKEEKAMTRMLWLLWKVYHNWGCVSKDSDALVSQGGKSRGKPDAESLGTNSKVRFTKVYATSSEYLGKERAIVGKNKCQSSSSAKSLRYEIWGPVPWRDWKARATRPKQGVESKLTEKDKVAFYLPAEEWVLPAASKKEPSLQLIQERVCVCSARKTLTLLSWTWDTLRTSRSLTTVMTASGEVQTREEASVGVKQVDLFVTVVLFWRNSRSSLLLETLWGSWEKHTTGPAVKNHVSSEMARELIAKYSTMYHLWFLVYQRVLLQQHFHLLLHHLHHRIQYLMTTDTHWKSSTRKKW